MKTLYLSIIIGIILVLTALSGYILIENQAYALWIPLSPQELLEQSKTIFVGSVTAVTPVDVQYQSQIARNGTIKQSVGPETMTLDEYTVHVEEFLKNPQNYDAIKLRQATVGGVPSGPSTIGGFKVGERVLFYLPIEGQTYFPMQYLPESFKIPQYCDGKDVLTQKRIVGTNNFTVIQNGIKVDYENFTANTPIKFLYDKDMNTLYGKSFEVLVGIAKITDRGTQPVFSQDIHAESKPCQWIASAEWEFTPKEGKYTMGIITKEGGVVYETSSTSFSVKPEVYPMGQDFGLQSPLKQLKSGVKPKDITCKVGLLIFKVEDGSPACVQSLTATKLILRGWALGTAPATPFIKDLNIVALQQNYAVGQQINATVTHTGYSSNRNIPDVKIFDANGTQVWFNCPKCLLNSQYTHTEAAIGSSYGNFTYHVRDPNGNAPVINKTGTYTMIASLENKKTEAKFSVSSGTKYETAFHDYSNAPRYSIVNATFGIPVENDSMATKLVGFNVSSPTYLPQGYEVKLIKVEKKIPLVTIFASKYPLTNDTTNEEFFYNDTGILITYSKANDFALKTHKSMWDSAPSLRKVTIDGTEAAIEEMRKGNYEGYTYDQWADLVLFKGDVIIGVRGFLSDDDLVKITTSMLENQK